MPGPFVLSRRRFPASRDSRPTQFSGSISYPALLYTSWVATLTPNRVLSGVLDRIHKLPSSRVEDVFDLNHPLLKQVL